MKIHVIEGLNLNSLYGEFHLNPEQGQGDTGLFLIHGPTGSGKSTLMDAVSLALFGTTPRLMAVGKAADIAEQIMSRGTGECRATVVFSKKIQGSDDRAHYRARWEAKRARGKPGGTVQSPSHTPPAACRMVDGRCSATAAPNARPTSASARSSRTSASRSSNARCSWRKGSRKYRYEALGARALVKRLLVLDRGDVPYQVKCSIRLEIGHRGSEAPPAHGSPQPLGARPASTRPPGASAPRWLGQCVRADGHRHARFAWGRPTRRDGAGFFDREPSCPKCLRERN